MATTTHAPLQSWPVGKRLKKDQKMGDLRHGPGNNGPCPSTRFNVFDALRSCDQAGDFNEFLCECGQPHYGTRTNQVQALTGSD